MEIKVVKQTGDLYKKIEVREPLVEDIIESKKYEGDVQSSAALIAQICTFDGKQITMEDVQKLPVSLFLDLQAELISAGFMGSKEVLSRLFGTDASTTKA